MAVSNVLRGLSFLPGNEGPMAKHAGLLYIIGRLLRLYTDERTLKLPGSLVKQLSKNVSYNFHVIQFQLLLLLS